ncbi:hypothetical protein [uncultured Tateyamaria sp.]|uniref:hypothetical protein n=1 Tax=uncultured Tateyamaria sp. TaxID=455651 RepID=UPI00260CC4C8|nr:hypothetical protein [uncultured Tateyamaria sp.]
MRQTWGLIENHPFRSGVILAFLHAMCRRKRLYSLAPCLPPRGNPVKTVVEQKPWNMNSIAGWVAATGLMMAVAICPQKSAADAFTGTEFLTWQTDAQESYFQTSVTMAAIIATETHKASSDCLADWYLSSNADRQARHFTLRGAIERNATYHPSAVIFLVLKQVCGPFVESVN